MSVTVVFRRQVEADREAALVGAARRVFEQQDGAAAAHRRGHLLQGSDNPREFLYIGRWDSREAIDAFRREARSADVEQLFGVEPQLSYWRQAAIFEMTSRKASVFACVIGERLAGSEALDQGVLRYLRAVTHVAPGGIVEYRAYRNLDDPDCYAVVHGWDSLESLLAFEAASRAEIDARLRDLGASGSRFLGSVSTSFDRLS